MSEYFDLSSFEKDKVIEIRGLSEKLDTLDNEFNTVAEEFKEEAELLEAKYGEVLSKLSNELKQLEVKHNRLLTSFWNDFVNRLEIEDAYDLTIDMNNLRVIPIPMEELGCEQDCECCEHVEVLKTKIKRLEAQLSVKKLIDGEI